MGFLTKVPILPDSMLAPITHEKNTQNIMNPRNVENSIKTPIEKPNAIE